MKEDRLRQLYLDGKMSDSEFWREYKIQTGDFTLHRIWTYLSAFWSLLLLK